MYVFGARRRGWRGGELMRALGLGFTNHVGTGGVLDVCLCLGCGGVGGEGGVGKEWVVAWTRVWRGGWCYVGVRCESGLSVYMVGPGICILCLADTCAY